MKPDLLRRLKAVERAIEQTSRPPLRLVDVMTFDPVDREAFWDNGVMPPIAIPVDTPPGSIHTLVIDLHESSRDRWHATGDMDDEDLETFEQGEILNEQRREAEERDARERAAMDAIRAAEPRYDFSGYPVVSEDSTAWGSSEPAVRGQA